MKIFGVKDEIFERQVLEAKEKFQRALAEKYSGTESLEIIEKCFANLKVELSSSLRTTGGTARYATYHVTLNYRLLNENKDQINQTFGHELAHIIAGQLFGPKAGHGPLWGAIMGLLGLPAERCHSMNVAGFERKTKRYLYRCGKCNKEYQLTGHKHNKQLRALDVGTYSYRCRCLGPLTHVNTP
jgi:SprT protein